MSKRLLYTIIIYLVLILGAIVGVCIIPNEWKYLFGFFIGVIDATLVALRADEE